MTTALYTRIATNTIRTVMSPLERLTLAFLNTVRTEHYKDVMTLTTMIPPFMQKISAQEIAPTPFHPITPTSSATPLSR
jgi:hypothetical protein